MLKQSPRCWNERIDKVLRDFEFKSVDRDRCLYVLDKDDTFLMIILYLDDGLIAGNSNEAISLFFQNFNKEFEITTGPVSTYLGLKIETTEDGSLFVHQSAYIVNVLKRFNMDECKPVKTPAVAPDKNGEDQTEFASTHIYSSAV